MEGMIIKVVLCIVVPILLFCALLEKRSRNIVFAVCSGCIACLLASYINTLISGLLGCSYYYLTTNIAPFIEELMKFIPIFIFSKIISKEKRYLLSASFATGIGFAIIENSFMLTQSLSTATIPWLLVRGIGAGLMHGMSSAIVGVGIYFASKDKRMMFSGTLATLFLAMMYHGSYNAMVQMDGIKFFAIFIPLISYALILFVLNKKKIEEFLNEPNKEK